MFAAALLGLVGVNLMLICFVLKLSSIESFNIPYLAPFAPTFKEGLKNSFIKFPEKKLNKRKKYLSNNIIKEEQWKKY